MTSPAAIWTVILVLGAGTYALRLSFLGLIGSRELPRWLLRLLAYVPVAVLPALVAPLVVWPGATGGEPDAPRMIAALAALVVGALARGVISAIAAGMAVLYLARWLFG